MPLQYQIKDGVAVLSLNVSGFGELRATLDAIGKDPGWTPGMPLLLDLRGEPPAVRYNDIASRIQILSEMREQFGPRWAFLIDAGPTRPGIWRMVSVVREHGGVDVSLFDDWEGAISWLGNPESETTFAYRVYVGTDEKGSFATLRWRGETLDPGVSWRLVGATDDEGIALGFLIIAAQESDSANRGRPAR